MEQTKRPEQAANKMNQDTIDLLELFFMLLANWKSIFLSLLIGAVLLGGYRMLFISPSYQANAEIYITSTDSVISISDLQLSAALTDDYAKIIKSRTVLKRAIQELGLNMTYRQLSNLVTVSNPDSTHIIDISVVCDDLELSRDIANALMNISVKQIYQIIGSGEPTVIDYAEAEAVTDVTPSLKKYVAMGGMLGIVVSCGFLVLKMLLDTTLKTEEDIDRYLHIPVLAAVPYYKDFDN